MPLNLDNSAAVKGFANLAGNDIMDLSLCLAWGLHYFTGGFHLVWQHHCKLVSFFTWQIRHKFFHQGANIEAVKQPT